MLTRAYILQSFLLHKDSNQLAILLNSLSDEFGYQILTTLTCIILSIIHVPDSSQGFSTQEVTSPTILPYSPCFLESLSTFECSPCKTSLLARKFHLRHDKHRIQHSPAISRPFNRVSKIDFRDSRDGELSRLGVAGDPRPILHSLPVLSFIRKWQPMDLHRERVKL